MRANKSFFLLVAKERLYKPGHLTLKGPFMPNIMQQSFLDWVQSLRVTSRNCVLGFQYLDVWDMSSSAHVDEIDL